MASARTTDIESQLCEGWATLSFRRSVGWAFLFATAVWMPVTVTSYYLGPEKHHNGTAVVLVNATLFALAAAAVATARVPPRLVFRLMHVVFIFNWAHTMTASTPFAVATYQVLVMGIIAEGLVLRRRSDTAFVVVWCAVAPTALYLVRPGYGSHVPISAAVTWALIFVVARPGLIPLLRFAKTLDENHNRSARATARLDAQRATVRRAAEEQRQIHDTAINTLAAIVRGGSVISNVEAVRAQCRSDSAVLEQLANASSDQMFGSMSPEALLTHRTINVNLSGLSGADLAAHWETLPTGVRTALGGAIRELVLNAEKHSEASEVVVEIRSGAESTTAVVSDQGIGFDPLAITERGLASSVRARLADESIVLVLDAVPGQGVRAEMTWWPSADQPKTDADYNEDVARISMIGALLISTICAVGTYGEDVLNHPGTWTPDYVMTTLVSVTLGIAWWSWRRNSRLTGPITALLIVVAPIAFLIAGSSVGFGTGYNLSWEAIAPPFVLFVVVAGARNAWQVPLAVAIFTATAITGAVLFAPTEAAVGVTLIALAVGLVMIVGWANFIRRLRAMARLAVRELEATVRAEEAADAQEAADLIRTRWRLAGIQNTVDLLHELGDSLDVESDDVRKRCLREETYLREVILLPPELVHIGAPLCQALSSARDRDVNLKVRSGNQDIDAATAERLGTYIVNATSTAKPGSTLIASLLDTGEGPQFRLVADDRQIAELAQKYDWGTDLDVEVSDFTSQVLVQVVPR